MHWPGIEPGPPAWQARILPLNHQCYIVIKLNLDNFPLSLLHRCACTTRKLEQNSKATMTNFNEPETYYNSTGTVATCRPIMNFETARELFP